MADPSSTQPRPPHEHPFPCARKAPAFGWRARGISGGWHARLTHPVRGTSETYLAQSCSLASRAPSRIAWNFAQITVG